MRFQFKTKPFEQALKHIEGIVKPSNVSVVCKKGKLSVGAATSGRTLRFRMPVEKHDGEDTKFTIPLGSLKLIVKSRAVMTFAIEGKGNAVRYSSGKYSGEILSIPFEPVNAEDSPEAVKITEEQQAAIAKAAEIAIHSVYDTNPAMTGVRLDKKGLTVAFFDMHHMSCRQFTKITSKKPVEFTIAAETFATINTLAEKKQFSLSMSDSTLHAWNSEFDFVTPLIQRDANAVTLDKVLALLESLEAEVSASGSPDEINTALQNAQGIYEQGGHVALTGKDSTLSLSAKSSFGKMNVEMESKVKGKFNVKIDPWLLLDVVAAIKEKSVKLNVHKNRFLWLAVDGKRQKDTFAALIAA